MLATRCEFTGDRPELAAPAQLLMMFGSQPQQALFLYLRIGVALRRGHRCKSNNPTNLKCCDRI